MTKLTIQKSSPAAISDAKSDAPDLTTLMSPGNGFSDEQIEMLKQAMANQVTEAMKKQTKKEKKSRKTKDPNAPKKPTTAYMAWLNASRIQIISDHFTNEAGECTLAGRAKVTEVAKKAGELWGTLSSEDKQPFVDANAEAKTDYEKAMEEYYTEYPDKKVEKASKKAGGGKKTTTKAKKVAFSTEDGLPTTPEGFSGAYTGYLKGSVKNPETGKNFLKKFADFNDATVEAMRLGDACGGITRTSKGYSLRAGNSVKENSNAGDGVEISWVKGDGSGIEAEVVSVDGPTSETASSTTTEEDFDAPTDDEGPPPLEEPEPDTEPVASPEPPAPVVDTPTAPQVKSIPITEDDDDSEDDDDDDDEEVDAEPWTWKGVTYFVDDLNDVMTEDGDIVGKRITIGGKTILKKC